MSILKIDNEFKNIIPPLQDEEYQLLENSILSEGCRDPLIVWESENTIIDGHNRYKICQEHNVHFDITHIEFADRIDAIEWICTNQLGRRNLTPEARADLTGKRYNNQKQHPFIHPKSEDQNDPRSTAEKIAEEVGVSAPTVKRDAKYSEAIDEIIGLLNDNGKEIDRGEITSGKKKFKKSHINQLAEIAKEDPDKAIEVWNKLEENNSAAIKSAIRDVEADHAIEEMEVIEDELIVIEHGDAFTLSNRLADETIDAIITDPPYPKEYLDCWNQLSELSMRVLKPGGWCIAYSGKQHLDQVFKRMIDGGLHYFWQIIFLQTVTPTIHPRSVNTKYKPILLFQKPPITKPDVYFVDVIEGDGVEKLQHEWQQSENGFEWLIKKFTNVGDLILDPFLGGGTSAVVAKRNNRRFIGYEIDEKSFALANKRIKEA
jgi:16S rRNA G966 N2-methylase RsmD